jgi:hypothetical protein
MEFSAATKSRRHWALRCKSRAALSWASVAPAFLRGDDGVDQADHRFLAAGEQRGVAVLHEQGAGGDLLFRDAVTRLAGLRDVEQRRAHVVVAHLDRAFAHVGHVAIRARDAAAGVDALAPHFELGVLGLQHAGAGFLVLPVVVPTSS